MSPLNATIVYDSGISRHTIRDGALAAKFYERTWIFGDWNPDDIRLLGRIYIKVAQNPGESRLVMSVFTDLGWQPLVELPATGDAEDNWWKSCPGATRQISENHATETNKAFRLALEKGRAIAAAGRI